MSGRVLYNWAIVAQILDEQHYRNEEDTPYYIFYRRGNLAIRLMKQQLEEEYVELVAFRIGMPFPEFIARYHQIQSKI